MLPLAAQQFGDGAILLGTQLVLHLHRLQHQQRLAPAHHLSRLYEQGNHQAMHGGQGDGPAARLIPRVILRYHLPGRAKGDLLLSQGQHETWLALIPLVQGSDRVALPTPLPLQADMILGHGVGEHLALPAQLPLRGVQCELPALSGHINGCRPGLAPP